MMSPMFDVEIWGTVASWVGGVGTASAFCAGVGYYINDRRSDRRGQASLVYVSPTLGSGFEVNNRSEKAIFGVKSVIVPMKMHTAILTGEFEGGKAVSAGIVHEYPSHDFYLVVRRMLKTRKKQYSVLSPKDDVEIAPNASKTFNVPELMLGSYDVFIILRDARGQDWAINVRTRRLQRAKRASDPRLALKARLFARWWIFSHGTKFVWDNYMYHPKGRPTVPD